MIELASEAVKERVHVFFCTHDARLHPRGENIRRENDRFITACKSGVQLYSFVIFARFLFAFVHGFFTIRGHRDKISYFDSSAIENGRVELYMHITPTLFARSVNDVRLRNSLFFLRFNIQTHFITNLT